MRALDPRFARRLPDSPRPGAGADQPPAGLTPGLAAAGSASARRLKAWAAANGVPVIYCIAGQRKHRIAEAYLAEHEITGPGVFLVLAAKAPATVWKVKRSSRRRIVNIEKKTEYVCHYSFHIMDPDWGHVTIPSGHPPFPAQVILNGHEYVAAQARAAGVGFIKEGNCFTEVADPHGLARVADALPRQAAIGCLGQVCDRWIYTACLCFGLDLAEQGISGFRYDYSVYQAEYGRNLLFRSGAKMEDLFDRVLDRTRSRLDIPALRTLFGLYSRPHRNRAAGPPAQEIVIEKQRYGLTWFRIRFGLLQLKAYTRASTSCALRPPCTTPENCGAAVTWATSARSSPGWPA